MYPFAFRPSVNATPFCSARRHTVEKLTPSAAATREACDVTSRAAKISSSLAEVIGTPRLMFFNIPERIRRIMSIDHGITSSKSSVTGHNSASRLPPASPCPTRHHQTAFHPDSRIASTENPKIRLGRSTFHIRNEPENPREFKHETPILASSSIDSH